MTFNKWIDTFLEEKGIEGNIFKVDHNDMVHYVEQDKLIEFIKTIPTEQKNQIKSTFVKIDFANGDCLHFLNHLANGYVIAHG